MCRGVIDLQWTKGHVDFSATKALDCTTRSGERFVIAHRR